MLKQSDTGSPELHAYSDLLKNYLGFIPEKDGYKIVWQADKFLSSYPYAAVSANVDSIKTKAKDKADTWFNDQLAKADQLAKGKKFREAMDLLENIPKDIIDKGQQDELKRKHDDLVLADAVAKETDKLAKSQELQRQWNNGMLLIKSEKFDQAIALFTGMLDTDYAAKAKEKIAQVSLMAAKADRRKAADLFIRFTKTSDLESKKKLLVESRKVLKQILVKYPDVEIADKVRDNIQKVEQEMNALDPALLPKVEQAESSPGASEQQPIDAFDVTGKNEQPTAAQPPVVEKSLKQ